MLHRSRRPVYGAPVGLPLLHEHDATRENPARTSETDWHAEGDVLGVRVPWMLMGFTDPSSLRVWDHPFEAGGPRAREVRGLRIYPSVRPNAGTNDAPDEEEVRRLDYVWRGWEDPTFHERRKESFGMLRDAYAGHEETKDPPTSDLTAEE